MLSLTNRKIRLTKEKWQDFFSQDKCHILGSDDPLVGHLTKHTLDGQTISKASDREKSLVDKSLYRLSPKELLCVQAYTRQGIVLEGRVISGSKRAVSSVNQIFHEIDHLKQSARTGNLLIDRIEILHTHLSLDFIYRDKFNPQLRLNSLSDSDMKRLYELKQFEHIPLVLKAISLSGLTYSLKL